MKFIDEAKIEVAAGKGGNGATSFRRENSYPAAALTAATAAKAAAFGQKPTKTPTPSSNTASSNATRPKTAKKGHGSDRYGAGRTTSSSKCPSAPSSATSTPTKSSPTSPTTASASASPRRQRRLGQYPLQILRQPRPETIHARRRRRNPFPATRTQSPRRRRLVRHAQRR